MADLKLIYEKSCSTRFPSVDEQELAAFERKYKLRLPPDYRQYLLDYNGGGFRDLVIHFSSDRSDVLTCMYGLRATFSAGKLGDDINLFDGNDPPIIMPIGYTAFGSMLIIIVGEGDDNGHIVFQFPGHSDFHFLAESIGDFFGSLTFLD